MNTIGTDTRSQIKNKLKKIRMVLMDVDGVLTNGGIILGSKDQEFKVFNVQDGMGITLAKIGGLKVGFITGRKSEVVERRARELKVDVCYQGSPNKLGSYQEILKRYHLCDEEICYIGDDLLEMVLLKRVGISVAVANARPEVKKICDYVTRNNGGCGAVRETVELILKGQNRWKNVLNRVDAYF